MGFMDKMKDLVGITDEYDDDYDNITQEEIDAYKNELSRSSAPAPAAAAAAAPEPPISTGISPLAFSEVAPPQKFTESKEPVDRVSRNDSGAFKMVVIAVSSSTISEQTSLLSSISKRLRQILPAKCLTSSAELHTRLRAASRESTRISTFLPLIMLTLRQW